MCTHLVHKPLKIDRAAMRGPRSRQAATASEANRRWSAKTVEPMTGIAPAYSAWEGISTPERMRDNRRSPGTSVSRTPA
jgi:hypothetical protein